MSEFIVRLEGITDQRSVQIALQSVDCFVLYPFHRPRHMPMVPADQVIRLEDSCHGDVNCIGITSPREGPALDVGPRQSLNLAGYGQNVGFDRGQLFENWLGVFRFGSQHFGHDHPGDQTSPANTVQTSQQSLHGLLAIARLARHHASPNTGFNVKGWRRHAAILWRFSARSESADATRARLAEGQVISVPSVVLLALPAQRSARLHARHRYVARRLPLRA